MALGGSGWKVFTRISRQCWSSSTLHFGPTLFLQYINDLPDDVICNNGIYADASTFYSRCDQAPDMWKQLQLASELESDQQDAVDWSRKWLVDFNAGKA